MYEYLFILMKIKTDAIVHNYAFGGHENKLNIKLPELYLTHPLTISERSAHPLLTSE